LLFRDSTNDPIVLNLLVAADNVHFARGVPQLVLLWQHQIQ